MYYVHYVNESIVIFISVSLIDKNNNNENKSDKNDSCKLKVVSEWSSHLDDNLVIINNTLNVIVLENI